MAYEGEVLTTCGDLNIDCSRIAIVAVSGSGPNFCGHLILCTRSNPPMYFHVAEVYGVPRYMSEQGFQRYLKENGKTEIRRRYLELPNPEGANLYLENLLANTWTWLVLPNNCVAFVEEVIHAGGGTWSSYSNCPTIATADTIGERANRFMSQVDREIYQLYGVPSF